MRVISFLNNKGGVGKTTSCLNIGAGLARKGKRVLLIDLDSQMNLSQSLRVEDSERNIYGALSGRYPLSPVEVVENMDIVPSSMRLRDIETEFASRIGGQVRLRKILSEVKGYDYCLIDCPPSLSLLSINAMTASSDIIVPLTPEYYSIQGIIALTQAIQEVQDSLNPSLRLSGIIINLYNKQKIVHRELTEAIEARFGDIVFKNRLRSNVAIEESPTQGLDIFRYDSESNGAKDFEALIDEFLTRL